MLQIVRAKLWNARSFSAQQVSVGTSTPNDLTEDPRAQRRIAYWLFACCAIVFGIVVLGGTTRLTRSGLSMVCPI
jgi:hypothetical protein